MNATLEACKNDIERLEELADWIPRQYDGLSTKGDFRHQIPAALFDISLDHFIGIVRLLACAHYAPAFALIRCQFEVFVRGAWIYRCATDDQIERFVAEDRIDPTMAQLIAEIETKPGFDSGFLSKVKQSAWNAMNGYTHGGIHQVSRRMRGTYVELNFEPDEVREAIQFCGALALLSLASIGELAASDEVAASVSKRLDEWKLI